MSNTAFEYLYQVDLYNIPGSLMIIIARPWNSITEDEKGLLAKILGSVRVGMGAVNVQHRSTVALETLHAFGPQKVLIFGSSTNEPITPYQKTVVNGISIIKADDFHQLDDLKKKNLWVALKQMFGM